VGKTIGGRYQMDTSDYGVIGVGGMGTVYTGVDATTGQAVAIKQLRSDIVHDQPEAVERFAREAQALRKLNHPHIVAVFETLEDDDTNYIIMEYIDGGSLRDALTKQSGLPIDRVLEIALDVSDALARAHRLNIIHRDIKPANILMTIDGSPKLSDFGVARLEDEPGVTRTGTVIGTMNYLAPEALNGLRIDERSDIWSFGVVLYEMITGHLPFESPTITGLITKILTQPPTPISQYRDDVPPELDLLIEQMLVKDHDQRISSVRQVGAVLENIIRGDSRMFNMATGAFKNPTGPVEIISAPSDMPTEAIPASQLAEAMPQPDVGPIQTPSSPINMDDIRRQQAIPTQQSTTRNVTPFIFGGMFVMIVFLVGILIANPFADTTTSNDNNIVLPDLLPIEPYQDQYRVLVAQFGTTGETAERDVERGIIDDLNQQLVIDLLSSNFDIVSYPLVITSAEQASEIAQDTDAILVIWGDYTNDTVRARIQLGSLTQYPDMPFDFETLERATEVTLILDDVMDDSLTTYVVSAIANIVASDGDVYGWARMISILTDDDLLPVEADDTLASDLHDFSYLYTRDYEQSLLALEQAITKNPSFALSYWLRSVIINRKYVQDLILTVDAQTISVLQDTVIRNQSTALQLAPEGWVAPLYSNFVNDRVGNNRNRIALGNSLEDIDLVIETRPNYWAPLYLRSELAHQDNDATLANSTIQQALVLNPPVSLPYTSATMQALRDGELLQASQYIDTIVQQLNDPTLTQRIFDILLGIPTSDGTLPLVFSNLVIGQYEASLDAAESFLNNEMAGSQGIFGNSANVLLMSSIAQCGLGNFQEAEFGLQVVLSSDRDFDFARLMRADVRLARGDDEGAQSDIDRVLIREGGEIYQPYADAILADTLGCQNILSSQTLESLLSE